MTEENQAELQRELMAILGRYGVQSFVLAFPTDEQNAFHAFRMADGVWFDVQGAVAECRRALGDRVVKEQVGFEDTYTVIKQDGTKLTG